MSAGPKVFEDFFTDSEDELPVGWEARVTDDGKVFYLDHQTRVTQWLHPKNGKRKQLPKDLPFGWEKTEDEEGVAMYIDRIHKKTTYVDPRLAYAISEPKKGHVKYDSCSTALEILRGRDLTGLIALVTGANSGIGYETARALALHGCQVVMACRDVSKGKDAATQIKAQQPYVKEIPVLECDLSSLASVKNCASQFLERGWPLHILVCNAGVLGMPFQLSPDGIELTFATNHLGHFYLTELLTDTLVRSAPARVVVVSSESHRFPTFDNQPMTIFDVPLRKSKYWSIVAYNQSKLCNLLFAFELNRRLQPLGVTCNALHPGNMVYTRLQRNSYVLRLLYLACRPFAKSKEQGAATTIYCATAPELEGVGGYYFNNCCGCEPSVLAKDTDLSKRLWELSERLVHKRDSIVDEFSSCIDY